MRWMALWIVFGGCGPIETNSSGEPDAEVDLGPGPEESELRLHLDALEAIAVDNAGNRSAGSAGYDASVDYVITTLEGLGFEPYTHAFLLNDFRLIEEPSVVMVGAIAEHNEDYLIIDGSGSASVTASVVAIDVVIPPGPENSSTSGCESSDFHGFPSGAIALIQRGSCTFQDKIDLAVQAGAAAVVIFNEGQPGRQSLFGASIDDDNPDDIPLIGATFFLGEQLAQTTEPVTIDILTERISVEQHNVLVSIPGTTEEVWMMGGHLDSVPAGPGINDNGTGVALQLELARLLADNPGTGDGALMAFWGAEESGLVGSLAWVADQTDFEGIQAYLNYDMVGSPNPGRFVYDGDGSDTPWDVENRGPGGDIERGFVDWYDAAGIGSLPTQLDGRSDYLGFLYAGVPTGGLFSGASEPMTADAALAFDGQAGASYDPCYHQDCDTTDNVNFEMLTESATAAYQVFNTFRRSGATASESGLVRRGLDLDTLPVRADNGCHGATHAAEQAPELVGM